MQIAFRSHLKRLVAVKQNAAFSILKAHFTPYLVEWKERRRLKAAAAVDTFLIEVSNSSYLLKIVKRYRASVIKAQCYGRAFCAIKAAQIDALKRYFDRLEILHRAQKATEDAEKKSKPNNKLKKKKDESPQERYNKIIVLLTNDLTQRRIQYRKDRKDMDKIENPGSTRLTNRPKIFFRVLIYFSL